MTTRTILILFALLALAPVSRAQDSPRHPGHLHHRPGKAAKRLGLTGDQREQVKAIARQHKDELGGLRQAVRAAREELQRVLGATPQDSEAVRAASRSVSAAQENLAVARGSRRAAVRTALTPEQQAKAAAHEQTRAQRHADREQRHAARKAERKATHKAGKTPKVRKA